ncbi:MAG: hypothetical protein K1000chlam2_01625 [Chlamydiae bacterium]|nr:hypothetical protein [Chlamydiota bacterium]
MTINHQVTNQLILSEGYLVIANKAIDKGRVEYAEKYTQFALECFQKASPDEHLALELGFLQERLQQLKLDVSLRMPTEVSSSEANFSPEVMSGFAPVGITRPKGVMNCWGNSLMQTITNSPALTRSILDSSNPNLKPIQSLIGIYHQAQQNPSGPIDASFGQILRLWASSASNNFSSQEDPADVFAEILFELGQTYTFQQELIYPDRKIASKDQQEPYILFEPKSNVLNFHDAFTGFFNSNVEGEFMKSLKFKTAPEDLVIKVKRDPNSNLEVLRIPETYDLHSSLTINNEKVSYALTGCLIFYGDHNNGHYISLQKKPDGWYLINDHQVKKITDLQAINFRKSAYMFHYSKEQTTAPIPVVPVATTTTTTPDAPIIKNVAAPASWKMWALNGALAITANTCRFVFRTTVDYLFTKFKKD